MWCSGWCLGVLCQCGVVVVSGSPMSMWCNGWCLGVLCQCGIVVGVWESYVNVV